MSRPTSPIVLSLALACSSAAAAPVTRRVVGILPIDAMNVADREAQQAESALRRIIARRAFAVLPAPAVARTLRGRSPQCAREVPCLRQVGRALGADTLLVLRAGRLGHTLVVQLSAFDVQRGARQGTWEELLREGGASRIEAALQRMVASFAPPPPATSTPWYRRWWVWTALGAAVAGTAVAIALGARDDRPTPDAVISPPPQ